MSTILRKTQLLITWLMFIATISACAPATTPSLTSTPTIAPTATFTPTSTFTPTPTETSLPTAIVRPAEAISPANVDEMELMAQIGIGLALTSAWSPDGETLAVGTGVGLYLLDGHTLEQKLFIQSGYTKNIAWSPDGQTIATGYDENTLLANWDATSGQPLFTVQFSHGRIDAMAFNAAGQLLTAGVKSSGTIAINNNTYQLTTYLDTYDPKTGQRLNSVSLVNPKNKSMGLIPFYTIDGSQVQTMGYNMDGSADLAWLDARTGQQVYAQSITGDTYTPLPTFGNLAVVRRYGSLTIQVVDLKTGQIIAELKLESSPLNVLLTVDGKLYILTKGSLASYDLQTLQETGRQTVAENVQYGAFTADFSRIAIKDKDTVLVRESASGEQLGALGGFYDFARNPVVSTDGRTLLTLYGSVATNDVRFWLWDVYTLQPRVKMDQKDYADAELLVVALPGGEYLIGKRGQSGLTIYDAHSGQSVGQANLTDAAIYSMDISQDGRVLQLDNTLWDLQTKTQLSEIPAFGYRSTWRAGLSADGSRAMFKDDDYLLVWDVQSGEEIFHVLAEMNFPVFSPQGNRLAFGPYRTGKPIQTIQLWDVDSGKMLREHALKGYVLATGFSPDGSLLLVSANNDGLYFIDAASGEMLHKISYDPSAFTFTAGGEALITTSGDGTIRFWGIPIDE